MTKTKKTNVTEMNEESIKNLIAEETRDLRERIESLENEARIEKEVEDIAFWDEGR